MSNHLQVIALFSATTASRWQDKIVGRWHYRDLRADVDWRDGWISFDTITFNPDDGQIYCGLNSIDADILYRFDPKSGRFTSLNTKRWADRFDVKIHRTLLHNPKDRCLYFGTSMLHDVDQQPETSGGKLVRYDPVADTYEVLGVPAPMLYIQSIAADFDRGYICGFTYPRRAFFEFNLRTRQPRVVAWTGNAMMMSQPHNPSWTAKGGSGEPTPKPERGTRSSPQRPSGCSSITRSHAA